MRLLLSESGLPATGAELDDEALRAVYAAPPDRAWLRVNFVSTLDGAVSGADGRSGSINTPADHRVFRVLRGVSDAVVVGAGTARAEGYPVLRAEDPVAPVLVVVSNRGELPPTVAATAHGDGSAVLVTRTSAGADVVARARELLGPDHVVTAGDDEVDLVAAVRALHQRGLRQLLSEGGPGLFSSLLRAQVVDEVDLTWTPLLVGGDQPRILSGPDLGVSLTPMTLVEEDGTVLGRWRVGHRPS